MDWINAFEYMTEGFCLRREGWSSNCYIRIEDRRFVNEEGDVYTLTVSDMDTRDWELVKDLYVITFTDHTNLISLRHIKRSIIAESRDDAARFVLTDLSYAVDNQKDLMFSCEKVNGETHYGIATWRPELRIDWLVKVSEAQR